MLRRYLLRHRHRRPPKIPTTFHEETADKKAATTRPFYGRRQSRAVLLLFFLGVAVWTRTRNYHQQKLQEEQRQRRSYIQDSILYNHTHKCVLSIATLVSSRHRQETLMATLQSIVLDQTVVPRYIQIHYSSSNNITFPIHDMQARVQEQVLSQVKKNNNHIQHEVHITWQEAPSAWRSSAKVIGPLLMIQDEPSSNSIHVLIAADDDVVYHPTWLESLLVGHLHHPTAVIGMRGWRMHSNKNNKYAYGAPPVVPAVPDGIWGSFPATESYVVMGGKLQSNYPYRVHVVTHVHGVLYPISYLVQQMRDMYNRTTTSTTQQQLVALGELLIGTPPLEKYRSMDDVWISGHMARLQIPRWIVPTVDQSVLFTKQYAGQVGIHLGQDQTVIPESRATTNQQVVDYFQNNWEDMQNDDDSPRLAGWLPLRHWLSRHVIIRAYQWHRRIQESFGKKTKKGGRLRRGHH